MCSVLVLFSTAGTGNDAVGSADVAGDETVEVTKKWHRRSLGRIARSYFRRSRSSIPWNKDSRFTKVRYPFNA